jgi:hypothetical protein
MKYLVTLMITLSSCTFGEPKFTIGQVVEVKNGFYRGCLLSLTEYVGYASGKLYKGHIVNCPGAPFASDDYIKNMPEDSLIEIPITRPSPTSSPLASKIS